ncbi:response regulator [Saitoella complicata NRRL Y-17804]|nr:response regulator [Saitoella complicata NRRL Y-17804]ODQ51440.1 response regulator [Saitoella complicata NRRL Y-17804]
MNVNPTGTQPSSSDFVKKLFKMLQDPTYRDVVRWSSSGDSFIVLETNEFTKSILPRHFKHSNFASFVRQLNKYDFHKVRYTEEGGVNPYGDGAWEFKHPDFQIHNRDSLDNIKRKAPSARKPAAADEPSAQQLATLSSQVDSLTKLQNSMNGHLQKLSRNYQSVIGEMLNFQRNMVAQDALMQNLISYLVNLEGGDKNTNGSREQNGPFVPSEQAQKLISSYTEVARASFEQMSEISKRAQAMGMPGSEFGGFNGNDAPNYGQGIDIDSSRSSSSEAQHAQSDMLPHPPQPQAHHPQQYGPVPPAQAHEQSLPQLSDSLYGRPEGQNGPDGSLRVFTVGHLTPRLPDDTSPPLDGISNTMNNPPPSNMPHVNATSDNRGNTMRIHRSTFVPGWAVPPKVLLVEDDAVCRRLSSKFLQVFGCEIDMAVDGVSAVNKMNLAKYDLVLMDIVMPNLDGVSATSLIRQFDPLTPIISMTSNVQSRDVMTYFSHGMNDILPKPFTKDGLQQMLEKHLIHLKAMKEMSEVPRALPEPDDQQGKYPQHPRITEAKDKSVAQHSNNANSYFSQQPDQQSSMDSNNANEGFAETDYLQLLSGFPTQSQPQHQQGQRRGREDDLYDPSGSKKARTDEF